MPYNAPMTGRDTGLMNGMTRRSLASRGTGDDGFWHGQGNRAHSARNRQGPQPRPFPRLPLARSRKTARPISISFAPLRARPPAPIMPTSGRGARTDRHPPDQETTP